VPPVTSAAARNGPALDRSGSTSMTPTDSGPGETRHEEGRGPPDDTTSAPQERSIRAVIAMCGMDGTGGPECRTSRPCSNLGAASSSPDTSCEDPDASSTT